MVEEIHIKGWKGKDEISLFERAEYYRLIEHRKNKETGEIYENEHLIPKENVRVLWKIINSNCAYREEYKYKYLVRKLLEYYKFHEKEGLPLETFMEAFNGGKNRAKYYFPYLYYPLKILEAKGYIAYFGKGGIIKLTNDLIYD